MNKINENFITIYGCGGHARSVAGVLLSNNPLEKLVFVDENAGEDEKIMEFNVKKSLAGYDKFHIAVGDGLKRAKLLEGKDFDKLITVISGNSIVDKTSVVQNGCFIGHYAYAAPLCEIGKCTIINTRATVEHEVKIGDFCHIAPSATICGRSSIGNNVFIGVNATVVDKINVCSDVIIGAGAVVTRDITEPGIYAGVPAVRIKG